MFVAILVFMEAGLLLNLRALRVLRGEVAILVFMEAGLLRADL